MAYMKLEDKLEMLPSESINTGISDFQSRSALLGAQSSTPLLSLFDNVTVINEASWSSQLIGTSANNISAANESMNNSNDADRADDGQSDIMTQGCLLYWFILCTVVIGLLCILGAVGNITAFFVFWKDNIKTSSSFLFQGLSFIDTVLLITAFPIYCLEPIVLYTGVFKEFRTIQPFLLVIYVSCCHDCSDNNNLGDGFSGCK